MRYRLAIIILILSGMTSCENYSSCSGTTATSLGIGFYQVKDSVESDSIPPAVTVVGIGRAGNFYTKSAGRSFIRLPLNQTADSTAFYIQPDSLSQGDTLVVQYQTKLHFVSAGCGFATYFTLDTIRYTRHNIDSLAIPVKTITTTDANNVKIYYNP